MNRTLPFALLALVSAAGCELPSAPAPAGGPTGGLSEGSEHTAPSTAPAVCAPVFALECGQNAVGDTADWNAGATNVMANYPMGVGTFDGPEITYSFTAPADGAVTFRLVNPAPMEIDHDVFVLEEVCAPDHNVANGYNATTFEARRGQTYFLVVDGYNGAAGGFEVAVECANPAPPVEPPTGTPPGDPPAEPPCAAFHSDESESAPIQTTGASLPASVTSRSWTTPTSWTSWVDFAGVPGHGATHEGIDWIHADPDVAVVDVRAASTCGPAAPSRVASVTTTARASAAAAGATTSSSPTAAGSTPGTPTSRRTTSTSRSGRACRRVSAWPAWGTAAGARSATCTSSSARATRPSTRARRPGASTRSSPR